MTATRRKGARSFKDIPATIQEKLNSGELETANLVEWLAVDQKTLLKLLLTRQNRVHYFAEVMKKIEEIKKPSFNKTNEAIGLSLLRQIKQHQDNGFLETMSDHVSDVVRGWACYVIGFDTSLSLESAFKNMQPFAADAHFGVREIAWFALRQRIIENLSESIDILTTWAIHPDPNIRRFASEATRPRGVWCPHIEKLKQHPEMGLPILEVLKSDGDRYVQDSVGNWLNDASKTSPEFVQETCRDWEVKSATLETRYIVKKARRTLLKKNG